MTNTGRRHATSDNGAGAVAMIILMFAFTAGAIIWLSRDVDRAIGAAAEADSIAFQAARAAAQEIDPASLAAGTPVIDPDAARARARVTVAQLCDANHTTCTVTAVDPYPDRVAVTVQIPGPGGLATGTGQARIATGVTGEGT